MIACLSLNPCWDKTMTVPQFFLDAPNRVQTLRADVGGKGVNVARAAAALGAECCLVGQDYQGAPVAAAMAREGVACYLRPAPGEMRVNLKIQDQAAGRTLEINESGPLADGELLPAMKALLLAHCPAGGWAALSGSLPQGLPPESYAWLTAALKAAGVHVAVDCDGAALERAVEAGPDVIKPNAHEFQRLTGVNPLDRAAALAACRALHGRGVGLICLSLGAAGALLSLPEAAYSCQAPRVPVRGLQGAGDSMLAGLLTALARGLEPAQALAFASAAAGASVQREGTLLCRRADVEKLLPGLRVEKIRL